MEPPLAVVAYRGYQLVHWTAGGAWDICVARTGAFVTSALDEEDAKAIVDGWQLAR